MFIWPFGYVTSYPALFVLSIADTLGFAGYLAVNIVYLSEMMGPAVRSKVIMGAQVLAIFLLAVVLASLIPHYWIPGQYRRYLWLLAGLNIVVGRRARQSRPLWPYNDTQRCHLLRIADKYFSRSARK